MRKLKFGFIGTGAITDLHYLGYKDSDLVELSAICDTDADLLEKRSKQWEFMIFLQCGRWEPGHSRTQQDTARRKPWKSLGNSTMPQMQLPNILRRKSAQGTFA